MSAALMLLLVHVAATLTMTGLIWFVQIVHYPLFDHVGASAFTEYEHVHQRRTGWVVGPLMLAELMTAAALLAWRPAGIGAPWVWVGLALVAALWLSTAFVQVPLHRTLAQGFDAMAHRRLVNSNWWRTALWSARGILVLWMVAQAAGA